MKHAREGKKIRCKLWDDPNEFIKIKYDIDCNNFINHRLECTHIISYDILDNDWEIYEENKEMTDSKYKCQFDHEVLVGSINLCDSCLRAMRNKSIKLLEFVKEVSNTHNLTSEGFWRLIIKTRELLKEIGE